MGESERYRVTYVYEVDVPSERGESHAERYARNRGELVHTDVERTQETDTDHAGGNDE